VITIRHCVLAIGVLAPSVSAVAQDSIPSALVTNEDERAIAKHRLTVDNVRKVFAVDRELLALMKRDPGLTARTAEVAAGIDPDSLADSLTAETKMAEDTPEIAQTLEREGIGAREYALTRTVAIGAEMSVEALKSGALRGKENAEIAKFVARSQPVQFWRGMDSALKAEAAAWKKVREEMGQLRGQ
jgi:hypothetical protein